MSGPPARSPLRVPRDNNQVLCVPSLGGIESLVTENRAKLSPARMRAEFADIRETARAALQGRTASPHPFDAPIIMGGHQPELFHPGVWFKNFLIQSIAKRVDGRSVHVIVDHDLAKSVSLRVPSIGESDGVLRSTFVDLPVVGTAGTGTPWHLTCIDSPQIANTSNRICDLLSTVSHHRPICAEFFQSVEQSAQLQCNASEAFSDARRRIERRNGVVNEEDSMSQICSDLSWGRFVLQCFMRAAELHRIYNHHLQAFRASHRIRNPVQPVPGLMKSGDWMELPFWMYRETHPNRQSLWLRETSSGWMISPTPKDELRDRFEISKSKAEFEAAWNDWMQEGVCIRPKALMTTLYLRCFVSDVFVHGIGGGIYDELTDSIIRDFLSIEPPTFVTASASLFLPMEKVPSKPIESAQFDWLALQREEQRFRSSPELFLESSAENQDLQNQHRRLLQSMPERPHKREWHLTMKRVKESIRSRSMNRLEELRQHRTRIENRLNELRILHSREHSFLLFEENDVVHRLKELASTVVDRSKFTQLPLTDCS